MAHVAHDEKLRFAAKKALRYPPVEITGQQAVTVVASFRQACDEAGYRIHACAILPDHIHLVIGAHERRIRQIVGHLKSRATRCLKQRGQWYADERPVWGEHGWNVYLGDAHAVERAIAYVQQNPIKEGKRLQRWSIVTAFDLDVARQAALAPNAPPPKIGGAALKSQQQARRKWQG